MRGRRLRRTLTAHVRTWRPYTLWYIGLVGVAGHAVAAGRHGVAQLAAAWAVPTLIWVAAHYLGDYLDRELDAISKPQRPIPSGLIRPRTAVWCGTVLGATTGASSWPPPGSAARWPTTACSRPRGCWATSSAGR
ncbi:hypothetical protein GCM10009639_49040 [Kitasatospora putterlickiae]|uniref:Uncharacterized protein n=1 Tax=Kitasatospora putterlickiae TaxID=221725 RepID=A0ABP4J0N8_9ACTN